MGILPSFGTKKRRRGPSRSGADMMAKEEARFLRELRKRNPNKYAEIMINRMGFGGDNDGELAKFAKTIGALKEITGVDFADVMGGGKDDLKGMLKDFAGTEVGAAVIGGLITRFMPGAVQGAQPQTQVTVVEPAQPSQATIAGVPSTAQLQEPAKVSPSMECQLLLALFKNTPAEQAVAQLWGQNKPEIHQFLDKLGNCNSNDEVAAVFREILAVKPDLHEAIHWLASNPPYLAAVINALKGSNSVQPVPAPVEASGDRRKRPPHGL